MALAIAVTDGTTTVNLHDASAGYGIPYGGLDLGFPVPDLVFGASRHASYDQLADVTYRNRKISPTLYLRGTSLDNWVANYRTLQNLLYESTRYYAGKGRDGGAPAYLDYQLNGMTNSTRYDIVAGVVQPGPGASEHPMTRTTAPLAIGVQLQLELKPWGRNSALTTVTSGTLTNIGYDVLSVSAPAGDADTPAEVRIEVGQAARRIILWARSYGTVANFLPALEAETGHGISGYTTTSLAPGTVTLTNEADAAASNGNRLDLLTGILGTVGSRVDCIEWEITSNNADYVGTYQAFLRCRFPSNVADATAKFGIRHGPSGNDVSNDELLADNTVLHATDWRLLDVGQVTFPVRTVPSSLTLPNMKVRLTVNNNGAARNWEVDCLYLVPLDQLADVTLSAASSANDRLYSDALSVQTGLYLTNNSDVPQPETFSNPTHTFFTLQRNKAHHVGFLLMSDANHKHVLADTAVIRVRYYPLYGHAR